MRAFAEHRSYLPQLGVYAHSGKGFDFLAHWHPDVELFLVLEGRLTMGINGERRSLTAGELAVCASNDIHHYQAAGEASRFLMVIFRPEWVGYPGIWPSGRRLAASYWSSPATGELALLMEQILAEYEAPDEFQPLVLRGLVIELCGRLERAFTVPSALGLEPTRVNERIARAITYVRSHFRQRLRLAMVASQVNLSPSYFSRCFQASCGTGFHQYLNAIRMEAAQELLETTDRTIQDIAAECGFESARSFHRVFRTQYGDSPAEYRNRKVVGLL
jgi:AraC-like DNA-binding protein